MAMSDVELEWHEIVQLRIDPERRLIFGLLVPWGVRSRPESVSGHRFMFSGPETLSLPDRPSDVSLVDGHDRDSVGPVVGHGVRFEFRGDGLHGAFRVDDGPEGDEVLERAEGHALSVGVRARAQCSCGVTRKSCACDVLAGEVEHVALVDVGAFRDAQVYEVVAKVHDNSGEGKEGLMAEKDDKSKSGEDGATVLENADSALTKFQENLDQRFDAMADKIAETQERQSEAVTKIIADSFEAAFSNLQGPQTGYRADMAAARLKVNREEPVYRFDGNVRAPSMVRDFWRAQTERDHDAVERLRKFQAQQRDMVDLLAKVPPYARALFATDTSNASEVIPPGYRPDLFVNELMQGRPIVAQASRGTITDATPFVVPRFVSATDATADHVEGVNPTAGTVTLDQVTVSPGAISGSFELTREIVDASNPAIDAIALAAMREAYNQQAEAKAYAVLNINANVGVSEDVSLATLGTGATTDDVVITPIRDLLARYTFTRFAAPTGGVMGQRVTRNFANAQDAQGRPLVPSTAPQNAVGTGNAVTQSWNVDGLNFVPAWAVTEAVGDELALILNRADWWVWESPLLTFRFEEKQGPAIIEMALFSYYATQVLRPAGIFSLRAVT